MVYIRDCEFIRGNSPMTKEEVRILSISKMELMENYRVLDVGAGTGSISIQAAKECSRGEVIAIEKEKDAVELIKANMKKFNVKNLKIVEGEATEAEDKVCGTFDAIFIGGSGGNIEEIIKLYSLKLKTSGKIVLNFITLDNLYKSMNTLKSLNYDVECIQVGINKVRHGSYMMTSNNSIFILSGKKMGVA